MVRPPASPDLDHGKGSTVNNTTQAAEPQSPPTQCVKCKHWYDEQMIYRGPLAAEPPECLSCYANSTEIR